MPVNLSTPHKSRDDEDTLISLSSSSHTSDFRQEKSRTKVDSSVGPSDADLCVTFHRSIQLETTSPSLPVSKRKALLIGIQNYNFQPEGEDNPKNAASGNGQLKGPHVDVQHMRQLLLDCYDYSTDDITVLIDDGNPEHVQPTEENLVRCMKDLVAEARSGDEFYLHFSGHGTQLPDDNGDEEDGFDECILTCDNKIITDDILNQLLVAPLPVGSTFVSSLDSCHSGTLLDLAHYRCNQVYVPWVNKGVRRTAFLRNIVTRQETQISDNSDNSDIIQAQVAQAPAIQFSEELIGLSIGPLGKGLKLVPPNMPQLVQHPTLSVTTHLTASNWLGGGATPIKYSVLSPSPIFCTGRCREEPGHDIELTADVISISSTKDYQLSWENSNGSSMTEALIKVLRKNPQSSLKHILVSISHELHTFYMDLHHKSRAYKDEINKLNIKRQSKGKVPCERPTVEMDNFQDPQLSSHRPLDMNRLWPLKPSVSLFQNEVLH